MGNLVLKQTMSSRDIVDLTGVIYDDVLTIR
jgi:hypothetical protein